MVELSAQEKAFLTLLLNSTKEQKLALLASATPDQVLLITEIFENLLTRSITEEERQFLKKRNRLVQTLKSPYKSFKARRQLFWELRHRILKVLAKFSSKLIELTTVSANPEVIDTFNDNHTSSLQPDHE